jgi:D-cysteine desulfhydrase
VDGGRGGDAARLPRLRLAHLPTPLVSPRRLAQVMGIDLWVKRDDATGGAETGNKVRKLEYLLADAQARGADTIVTCGGLQSNHARATALCAAALGMRAVLFLRTLDAERDAAKVALQGNVLLDRMVGAEIRLISPAEYRERARIMDEAARELAAGGARPYVVPEGGSNGLGSLGYVEAMAEVRRQLDLGLGGGKAFDVVVHACGSGGTAAGVVLGAGRYEVAAEVRAMAVCDDAPTFEGVIERIIGEAVELDPRLRGAAARLVVDDGAKGPAYAVSTAAQRRRMVEATRLSGLVFDPVYTGKALAGLWDLVDSGALRGERVLFIHTGGLPGLLAQGESFADSV